MKTAKDEFAFMNKQILNYWIKDRNKHIYIDIDESTYELYTNNCHIYYYSVDGTDNYGDICIVASESMNNGKKEIFYSFGDNRYFTEEEFICLINLEIFI